MNKINNKFYLIIILVLLTGVAHVAERLSFFYFNPDSTQSNLQQLKSDMDAALHKGEIQAEFQPFARLSDFDEQIRKKRPTLLYVPDWYLQRYGKELGLRPLLQSLRDDKSIYQKRLITSRHAKQPFSESSAATLAMTTMGPDSKTLLKQLIFSNNKLNADNFNIIEVPKDADAIFAVALGQVDSALVSSASLQLLEKRNPRLTASIQVIADSRPINLPVLCYLEGSISEHGIESLRKRLIVNNSGRGKSIPQILGIDAWGAGS